MQDHRKMHQRDSAGTVRAVCLSAEGCAHLHPQELQTEHQLLLWPHDAMFCPCMKDLQLSAPVSTQFWAVVL